MSLGPVLQSLADHAAAIAALPGEGPLAVRTALVASERQAHALRCALVRSGHSAVLAGTRFVGAGTLARELLQEAGVPFTAGEEALRPARILALIEEGLPLEHFDLALLRSTPGWPEAFAAALSDLEGALLTPATLPGDHPRWRDLRLLWTRLDEAAGRSFTTARIYREAAALLAAGAVPATGPILAAVTGRETAALAGFLRALPRTTLSVVAARPHRPRHVERLEALFGPDARAALTNAPLPAATATERDLLARNLFASPELLADPSRPRSQGDDGTVTLEEHSGVEAELEATAEWVAREVLERGTPLRDLAVLVPGGDALATLVASRIARLPWPDGRFPVHVAGGIPLTATAGGARVLALVRALQSWLPAAELAAILPALRTPQGRAHLTRGEALSVAFGLSGVGGSPARPEGSLEWPAWLQDGAAAVEARIAALSADEDGREGDQLRERVALLRAIEPALSAVVAVARLAVDDAPLSTLAPALLDLVRDWLVDPGPGAPVHALLRDELAGASADAVGSLVTGADALAVVEERLLALRLPTVRFGDPAVVVSTLAGASGLEFEAVRVVGLAEGALPSAARDDAVLPDRMREQAGPLVPRSADRVTAQLHDLDRAVRGARSRIALSVPRSDLERSDRETSSLLVEVGAAIGRPDEKGPYVVPDLEILRRAWFAPARAAAARFRADHPVTAAQWQDRAAARGELPPSWANGPALDLSRILTARAPEELDAADGVLGEGPFPSFPGLTAERPISASALGTLLGCPLRFLYERVLKWTEPDGAGSVRVLDPLTYGSLFHSIAEHFYRAHGPAFVAHQGTLEGWQEKARALAREAFRELRRELPLVGRGVEEKERNRLLADVDSYLAYDWRRPLTRFVGVELAFDGLILPAGDGELHVRGFVDRIDVEQDRALVLDLKSGRDHRREGKEEDPTPTRDVQLGLYSLVARRKAREWKLPRRLAAAYVYPRSGEERAFRDDHELLETATARWLAIAHGLLAEGSFPPTPDKEDCGFCPFRVACDGRERAADAAATGEVTGAVADFLALKTGAGEEEP